MLHSQFYRFTISHPICGITSTIVSLSLVDILSFPFIRELRKVLVGIDRRLDLNEKRYNWKLKFKKKYVRFRKKMIIVMKIQYLIS